MGVLAADVDDETVWIGQEEGVVVGKVVDFEDDARTAGLELGDANLFEESVVDVEALPYQG